VLAGVAEGLTVGDGRGDLVGRGEVDVRAGAVDDDDEEEEEEVVPGRVVSADAGRGTGRTRI
jgi:predicted aconitase with swiveling domain